MDSLLTGETLPSALLKEGLVTSSEMESALEERYRTERPLPVILADRGILTENVLLEFFRSRLGIETISLSDLSIGSDLHRLIPKSFAEKKRLIPVRFEDNALVLAMADPSDSGLIDDLKKRLDITILPRAAVSADMDEALARYPDSGDGEMRAPGRRRALWFRMLRGGLFPAMLLVPIIVLLLLMVQSSMPNVSNAVSRWVGHGFDFGVQFFVLYSTWCVVLWFFNGLIFPPQPSPSETEGQPF